MKTKYGFFTECQCAEDLKKEYRRLAKKYHPDMNPDVDTTEIFKELQADFEQAFDYLKNVHFNASGEMYEKETEETAAEFMNMINRLLIIPGIEIELCGSWIWITGNTKAVKDLLKEFGFRFSRNKLAWYFHREPYRKRSKKKMTLDDIRRMYGSRQFHGSAADPDALPA